MATFYFNAAVDGDWQTLGNWWMSYNAGTDTHSVSATALPTSTDSIEVRGDITGNSGSAPTVANAAFFGFWDNSISITVTGDCTFNDNSYHLYGTITGNCTFNDSSGSGSTITGNCTFNDSSANGTNGTITGDCTFNDSSYNWEGTITGNCTFNGNSFNLYSALVGDCTFNDTSGNNNGGTITGDCTFNDSSTNSTDGTISGDCTFNESSTNKGNITGNCTINDNAFFDGDPGMCTVTGDCTLNGNARFLGGLIDGNVTLNDSSHFTRRHPEWGNGGYTTAVTGTATFSPSAAALTLFNLVTHWNGNFGDAFEGGVEIIYDKGINGSSILGVV